MDKSFKELTEEFDKEFTGLTTQARNAKYGYYVKNHDDFKKAVMNETSFLPSDSTYSFRLECLKNNINSQPICLNCGKPLNDLKKYCSKECHNAKKSEISKKAWNDKSDEDKEKMIQHYKNSYAKAFEEKYGIKNATNSSMVPEIVKKKMIDYEKRTGLKHWMLDESVKEKMRNTNIKKYGKYSTLCKGTITREKIESENLKKYGDRFPINNEQIRDKFFNSGYKKTKKFIFENGKEVVTQGYNPIFFKILESYYEPCDILCETECPKIKYEMNNATHFYLPDAYIPKINTVFEVKCDYTFQYDYLMTYSKAYHTLKNGYNYTFVYFNKDKNIHLIHFVKINNDVNLKEHLNFLNYPAIYFYENELYNKFEIVQSMIKDKIETYGKKNLTILYGRNTIAKVITKQEGNQFLENNHLHGKVNTTGIYIIVMI